MNLFQILPCNAMQLKLKILYLMKLWVYTGSANPVFGNALKIMTI